MKLPPTAATEMNALSVFARLVNRVIAAAEISGNINVYHGSELLVVKFKISNC